MAQKSDLPFGSEFSPSQIELPALLDLVVLYEGDVKRLESAIQARFFSVHGGGDAKNQAKLAMNCRLGMKAYGIIDDEARLTDFGRQLYNNKNNESKLYETFARHILLNLKGMALVQCIRDMTTAGEVINLTTLRRALAERNIYYPPGGKHPSIMRLWLAKAGIFVGERWQIDELRMTAILGASPDDYSALSHLTREQRAFLLALANTSVSAPQPANEIVKLASATYGIRFPEKSLPKQVLNALVEAGYITITKTTAGRGAKPFLVAPTAKLNAEIVAPFLEQLKTQVDPRLIDLLRKSLVEIMSEIDSQDRYTSGLGLEALAFKLMRLLDMKFVATRLRAQATGGAETDLIFESDRLIYSRWQVQCKNTSRVSLDDVAKEVGLSHLLKSNAVIMVSTGFISEEARRYANKIMTETNLCIVMIDRADLNMIRENPTRIVDVFHREARHAMKLKRLEL